MINDLDEWVFHQDQEGIIKKVTCNGHEIRVQSITIDHEPMFNSAKIGIKAFYVKTVDLKE